MTVVMSVGNLAVRWAYMLVVMMVLTMVVMMADLMASCLAVTMDEKMVVMFIIYKMDVFCDLLNLRHSHNGDFLFVCSSKRILRNFNIRVPVKE